MRNSDITVHMGAWATEETIALAEPDVVILATGSQLKIAPWPNDGSVLITDDCAILMARVFAGPRVVVAGGGSSGAETAEFLADLGHAVTFVEMRSEIAGAAPIDERALLLQRLQRLGVEIRVNSTIQQVTDGKVYTLGPGDTQILPADTVVVCQGVEIAGGLLLAMHGAAPMVLKVGDCASPRRVLEAIAEGEEAGRTLRQPAVAA